MLAPPFHPVSGEEEAGEAALTSRQNWTRLRCGCCSRTRAAVQRGRSSACSRLVVSSSSAAGSSSDQTALAQAPPSQVAGGGCREDQDQDQDQTPSSSDLSLQAKEEETPSGPESSTDCQNPDGSSSPAAQPSGSPGPQQNRQPVQSSSTEPEEVQEEQVEQQEQHIYIQTHGLDVQMSEPGMDRIVIVNGPDGTTMHIQTPEDVPLEAVHALLGIEASNEGKASE